MRNCRFIKKRVSGKVKLASKQERWHNLVEEGSAGYAIF